MNGAHCGRRRGKRGVADAEAVERRRGVVTISRKLARYDVPGTDPSPAEWSAPWPRKLRMHA